MNEKDENVAHAASYQIQKTQKFEPIENSPWTGSELNGRMLTVNEAKPMVKRDFSGGGRGGNSRGRY